MFTINNKIYNNLQTAKILAVFEPGYDIVTLLNTDQ